MKLSQTIVLLWVARNLEWLLFISKKNEFWNSAVVKYVLTNYPER